MPLNKNLFSLPKKGSVTVPPPCDTVNEAGGVAYESSAGHALALFACTGCLNGTYYTTAEEQLEKVLKLALKVEPEFLAKTAVYAHEVGFMRDMPALLLAVLSRRSPSLLTKVFSRVINSGNMIRNFCQIMRSGATGRKSLGSTPKGLVRKWFADHTAASIFHQSIGNDPTLGEVIKWAHPKPDTAEKAALYAYLQGVEVVTVDGRKFFRTPYLDRVTKEQRYLTQPWECLPEIVRQFEAWKADRSLPLPKVNFRFLDSQPLTADQWKQVAHNANWLTTVKSLNSWAKQSVFNDRALVLEIAARIRDEKEIRKVRAFPYQILSAYLATDAGDKYCRFGGSEGVKVPNEIKEALQDAMEVCVTNVPSFTDEEIYLCEDVSGSMHDPVTGNRKGSSTRVRCVDVAALIAASVLRNNRNAVVIPFKEDVIEGLRLNPRDTVISNAEKLSSLPPGGTNCSAPLVKLNREGAKGSLVIFVSDYESWLDRGYGGTTGMMSEWLRFKARNPKAKLVCIDLTPRANAQVKEQPDILQIGGFNDSVWKVVRSFMDGGWDASHWVRVIESVDLDAVKASKDPVKDPVKEQQLFRYDYDRGEYVPVE